jgi:hypothetical protein
MVWGFGKDDKKFLEELIDYFPLIRHGPRRKRIMGDTDTQTAR